MLLRRAQVGVFMRAGVRHRLGTPGARWNGQSYPFESMQGRPAVMTVVDRVLECPGTTVDWMRDQTFG